MNSFKQYILKEELSRYDITCLSDEEFYKLVKSGYKINDQNLWTTKKQEYILNNHPKDFALIPAKYLHRPVFQKHREKFFGGLFK